MPHSLKTTTVVLVALAGFALTAQGPASAQTAPVPRLVISSDEAPEAVTDQISQLQVGENLMEFAGATWLQLHFDAFDLGETGKLSIVAPDGERQDFTQATLEAWEGLSAIFNGATLTVVLDQGAESAVSASIGNVIIGIPAATGTENEAVENEAVPLPKELRDLLGDDVQRFVPADLPRSLEEGALDDDAGSIEAVCGGDNRVDSNHPFSGRIMPIGCTGWIIDGGSILTAGHCIGASTQTLEFNVPASQANGTTVSPGVAHQYKVISSSFVSAFTGIGNDWGIFQVQPNTQTGLTAVLAQGGGFTLSNTLNPANVRITGYGVDGPSDCFGSSFQPGCTLPALRNADNQTQQTHSSALTENSVQNANQATLRYTVDTQGGNSGSPVIAVGSTDVAIGIHTNGGCSATGGSNAGTSFRNNGLWNAIPALPIGSDVATGWLRLLLK